MESLLILLAIVILLLLEGFFSGSEIALVNADKIKLHAMANQGHKGAKQVLRLFQRPDMLLTTTLVGTNICVVTMTTLATLLMIQWFGDGGDLYAFLLFTPLFLTFGEIIPKSIYQQKADQLAPIIVYPLRLFRIILYPVIFSFSLMARLATRFAGQAGSKQNLFITREKFRTVVDMADRGANVDLFDRSRIKKAIRFTDTTVGEAMVPIAETIAVNQKRAIRDATKLVRRHGYNRIPVYSENIGNIIGIVTLTVWDLMEDNINHKSMSNLIQPALYVSPLQNIDELLPKLRQRGDQMAIVVDEFGSAIGIITIEDIMEVVVGEIRGGYDFDTYQPRRKRQYRKISEDTYQVDSRVSISDINELLEIDLPATEYHTIGGFVETRLRHIPREGEQVEAQGWLFTVEQCTERAILTLRAEKS